MRRILLTVITVLVGCGGDAQVDLAATQTLTAVADQMELALTEYHSEVSQKDDQREEAVVAAFIERIKVDIANEQAVQEHSGDFRGAMQKIRADRQTESQRRVAVADNIGMIREVAHGLQKMAIQSLSLQDETRRYLTNWMELQRKSQSQSVTTTATNGGKP